MTGKDEYKEYADQMMESLVSSDYCAESGTDSHFPLMHNVDSISHNNEIDVSLNYAGYYFLEVLKRKRGIEG